MPTPPPGAQISEDGYYWWNENTGDPNEPARWEVMDDPASAATGAAAQAATSTQTSSPEQTSSSTSSPEQNASQDPSQHQSDAGDVTLEWQYTADDDMGVGLDDLVASGWEPGSEDETA